jgi:hypothetical protein
MPNGRIEIVHNFTGETDFVILVWRKTSAPLAEIDREVYPAPHSQQSLLIENLDPVMHTVTAYRSADGVALDAQINILACDAKTGAIFPITKYTYVVDRGNGSSIPGEIWNDPNDGDWQLRDERLKDKTYWIEERGTGSLTLELGEWVDRSDVGGGWDWPGTGLPDEKKFNNGAVYFAWVIERVDLDNSGFNAGSDYNDIFELVENQDFDPGTMASKLLIANWPDTVGTLTIPNLNLLPDCKFKLQTHDGAQRNVIIQLDAGNAVRFRGADENQIILGKGESIEILIVDNVMYVMDDKTGYDVVGDRKLVDYAPLNGIPLDGVVYNQVDVPRLMWHIDRLPIGQVVTEANWLLTENINGDVTFINKGKYARDDVAGTIRVPDDRNMSYRALKLNDGSADAERETNGVGGYQHFKTSMKGVDTTIEIREGQGGSSTGAISNTGFSGQDNPHLWIPNDSGGGPKYIRFNVAGANNLETRSSNVGLMAYLMI